MTLTEERMRLAEVRTGVRRSGAVLSIVFFVLTAIAIAAASFFLHSLATGIICLIAAEASVWVRASARTSRATARGHTEPGVIAALWLGGLFSLIFALPHSGKPEGLLLLGAACAIAGARLRNPFIGALATAFVVAYFSQINANETALMTGVGIAAISLVSLARDWQRPSNELLFITLMIVAPIAGAVPSMDHVSIAWSLAYIALAIAELVFAIRKRHHAAFYGAAVSATIAAIMLRKLSPLATEWKLIIAGALLFALSVAISRALRAKTSGFVMTPFKETTEAALRMFGTLALTPHGESPAAANSQPVGGGGSFGGAGASGDF